ncbi:MAG: exo-alpha-sialidase [Chloroflexi bacterium]|nr:MAG: exo-alpha-sialidase [Chloroflexota bacterium]
MRSPRYALAIRSAIPFVVVASLVLSSSAGFAAPRVLWASSISFTNAVASSPVAGGGYPVPDGSNAPVPGTCGPLQLNSNRSESWIAVKPGTEDLVGSSKFFIDKWSTFYNFHLGSYTIRNGTTVANNQVQGYECTTLGGSQDMTINGNDIVPPSWTNNTDPNVAFDTQGRVYQTTLPFQAYWTNLHPDGAIMLSYSDDMGQHWITGNGAQPLEQAPNASSFQYGHVEDKQWIAVNAIQGHPNQDHVYAMWSVFNKDTTKIRIAVSRDRGLTFSKAVTITSPSQTSPSNTYVYPSIDAAGDLYVAFVSFPRPTIATTTTIYVTKSTDDGVTFGPFVPVARAGVQPDGILPNTTFRDGIVENFAASPTYPGHLYVTWENWDGAQEDVMFSQSKNGGATWSTPTIVNDNVDTKGATDQFQPSVAAGPSGAVAVAFYDRRATCPKDASVLPQDVGRSNFCIDVTLQAYKDAGSGAVPVGGNVRITNYTWDPMNPDQHVDGIGQMACAAHRDPCTTNAFIGDYFGLAISRGNIYALFVSTHYPSSITADEGGPVYYQQQVLATVPRSAFGSTY